MAYVKKPPQQPTDEPMKSKRKSRHDQALPLARLSPNSFPMPKNIPLNQPPTIAGVGSVVVCAKIALTTNAHSIHATMCNTSVN